MQHILFIVNPIAGGRDKGILERLIPRRLDPQRFSWSLACTAHPGHAHELALQSDADTVVAVGGDGTVNEVASALAGTDRVLGILPCGSGDGLARHLRISRSFDLALRTVNAYDVRAIDHGTMNGRPFFCTCGVGLDALVSEEFARATTRGLRTYVAKTLETWQHFTPETYELSIDGNTVSTRAVLITAGNANQWGNEGFITPLASLTDSLIDVTVLRPFSPLEIPDLAARIFTKRIARSAHVDYYRCRRLGIHREKPGAAHLDGDPLQLGTDIDIRIAPDRLRIIIPSQSENKL